MYSTNDWKFKEIKNYLIRINRDNNFIDGSIGRNILAQICDQGFIKGAKLCLRNPYFYFQHGESTSTASQFIFQASPKKSGYKQSFASFTRPWVWE